MARVGPFVYRVWDTEIKMFRQSGESYTYAKRRSIWMSLGAAKVAKKYMKELVPGCLVIKKYSLVEVEEEASG
jgi:hypothetical protein